VVGKKKSGGRFHGTCPLNSSIFGLKPKEGGPEGKKTGSNKEEKKKFAGGGVVRQGGPKNGGRTISSIFQVMRKATGNGDTRKLPP